MRLTFRCLTQRLSCGLSRVHHFIRSVHGHIQRFARPHLSAAKTHVEPQRCAPAREQAVCQNIQLPLHLRWLSGQQQDESGNPCAEAKIVDTESHATIAFGDRAPYLKKAVLNLVEEVKG